MIRRKHYSEEFKRKIALEIIMGSTPAGEISKREGISSTTLYKWRDNYSSENYSSEEQEVADLKRQVRELKETISDLALENHILKKTEQILKQMKKQERLSGSISPRDLESK
jgi:transposase-like protein